MKSITNNNISEVDVLKGLLSSRDVLIETMMIKQTELEKQIGKLVKQKGLLKKAIKDIIIILE